MPSELNETPDALGMEEKEAAPGPPVAPRAPSAQPDWEHSRTAEQTLHLERSAVEAAYAVPAPRSHQPATGTGTAPVAPRTASVTVRSGPDTGARYPLEASPLYVGRAPDNGIVVNDPATSRRHARFEQRGQDFLVVDLGSANGTLVDSVRVVEQVLADGAVITMGQNELVVSIS